MKPQFTFVSLLLILLSAATLSAGEPSASPKGNGSNGQNGRNGQNGVNGNGRTRPVSTMVINRAAEGLLLKAPAGVFVDHTAGEVYVADPELGLVVVYGRETSWPMMAIGYNGEVNAPRKAVTDGQGRIYVLDMNPARVRIFTYRGEPLGTFAFPGLADASLVVPTALWADATGALYVGDGGAEKRILVYGADGALRLIVGRNGKGAGELSSVVSITTDAGGRIYVLDGSGPVSVLTFSPDGAFLRGWGKHEGGPGRMARAPRIS